MFRKERGAVSAARGGSIAWPRALALLAAIVPGLVACGRSALLAESGAGGGSDAAPSSHANGSGTGGAGEAGAFGTAGAAGGFQEVNCSPAPPLEYDAPPPPWPKGYVGDFFFSGDFIEVAVSPDGDGVAVFGDVGESPYRLVARRHQPFWLEPEWLVGDEEGLVDSVRSAAVAAGGGARVLVVYSEAVGSQLAICARAFEPLTGWSLPMLLGASNEGWWQEPVKPEPVIAMNAKGDAVVAWARGPESSGGIHVRRHVAGSGWMALDTLTEKYAWAPSIALHEDSSFVVAWEEDSQVVATSFDAMGWGPTEALAAAATHPRVSAGPDGTTVALWTRMAGDKHVIETAERSAMGTWSAPVTLEEVPHVATTWLATAASGDGVAAWSWPVPTCKQDAFLRLRDAETAWLPTITVQQALSGGVSAIRDVSASAGHAVIAWDLVDPSSCEGDGVCTSWFNTTTTSTWSVYKMDHEPDASQPRAAMGPTGRTLLAWRRTAEADVVVARWSDPLK